MPQPRVTDLSHHNAVHDLRASRLWGVIHKATQGTGYVDPTYAQPRQVFMRLQRVRNYLAANCHLDIDNDSLARMANYSPWHFIRAFRAAYEETPHAFLVRQRLERARRLLRASPLAIAEIALESGFENRSAFSRLFRQRFGTTAGALRRQAAGGHC